MKSAVSLLFCLLFYTGLLYAQAIDSAANATDSLASTAFTDSVKPSKSTTPVFGLKNKILNADAEPVSFAVRYKSGRNNDYLFYLMVTLVLILAFFRYFYSRYFSNLFRVFFNTSLRQSQLTDQLLQAKLPSLLFNIFFIISGGIYVYLLLEHYNLVGQGNVWVLIFSSVILLAGIYIVKYCTLKFTGWITGLKDATNIYIFIVFLINKIIGIFLVPFIIILSFSDVAIARVALLVSLMSIAIFLILRFFRTYGLLQNQLKISRFHFFLYITGVELLPLLLLYKGVMIYLSKNL